VNTKKRWNYLFGRAIAHGLVVGNSIGPQALSDFVVKRRIDGGNLLASTSQPPKKVSLDDEGAGLLACASFFRAAFP